MRKELKRRINKMMNELQAMKELIDSDALQEQPDNEDIDKVAQELYEHLYELKRRNNVPTNLYDKQEIIDLWKAGIGYGRSHPKQEQQEVDLEKDIHDQIMLLHVAPNYMELDRFACHFYDLGLKARKEQKPNKQTEIEIEEAAEKAALEFAYQHPL